MHIPYLYLYLHQDIGGTIDILTNIINLGGSGSGDAMEIQYYFSDGQLRIYDRTNINFPASGVTTKVSELVNFAGKTSTAWTSDNGADNTALGGTPVEILGAGIAATMSSASTSAVDIALGTSAGVVKTCYRMDESIGIPLAADRYIGVVNGNGNGDSNPSQPGVIQVVVEYFGID